MSNRWFDITIDKWEVDMDSEKLVTVRARIEAPTAQMATKALIDLATNNGRVVRFEVNETEESRQGVR